MEEILRNNWLKINTWNTYHPSDMKRFHSAIKEVFLQNQYDLHKDSFKEAIKNVLNSNNFQEDIEIFATKADIICSFLSDIND